MFIDSINWHSLFNKINASNSCIYIVLPGIDEVLAQLLIDIKKEGRVLIQVCIDNSEDVIRNGYGDAKGIDNLIENGVNIRESKGNRVSFIIIDNSGYILFPESRIFSEEPAGPNALELDAFTITRLLAYYFPAVDDKEREDLDVRFSNSIEMQTQWMHTVRNEVFNDPPPKATDDFRKDKHSETKAALIKNPPIAPNLQRQIKTYTAKIQFVELKFTGINMQSRSISIPKDVIPINNEELKKLLQTKMKLFQNFESNTGFEVLTQLKKKEELLRDDYLTTITCRQGKSIILVEMKGAFEGRLEKIKQEIQDINKQLPDLLETAILETKDIINAELLSFFKLNRPKELQQYSKTEIVERKLKEYVADIIRAIHFPKTEKLIENISLKEYYYDLTFQDFSDDSLIEEFKKKNILKDADIKGIVEMKNAFEEKQ